MAEAEAVAAAADAAEEAAAQAQAAAVAAEAERAEAQARAAAQEQAVAQAQTAAAATTPQLAVARPAVLSPATGRAGPYAEAAQSFRTLPAERQPALQRASTVPIDLQGQQQPQLQRTGSALEVVVAKTYKGWAVIGVLMLGFIIFLVIWSTV